MIRLALALALAHHSAALGAPPVAVTIPLPAPPAIDPSTMATKADLNALAAKVPKLADTIPLPEVMGGAAGTSPMALRADGRIPRVTQSQIATTVVGGTFSGTFPAGFFSAVPTISLTWVNGGALTMTCELTADPTPTTYQGRCRTISLTAILAGGAGIKVHVWAGPAN